MIFYKWVGKFVSLAFVKKILENYSNDRITFVNVNNYFVKQQLRIQYLRLYARTAK